MAHDRNGNMTRIPKPDDWDAHLDLTYDPWNRLVKVEDAGAALAEYQYDGRNFRIVKKLYDCSAESSSSSSSSATGEPCEIRHLYYNTEWQCLEERLEAAGLISNKADRQFLWGLRYIDDLLLRDADKSKPSNGVLDERFHALQDSSFTIAGIGGTDGQVIERYVCNPQGNVVVLDGSFTGRSSCRYDWEHNHTGQRVSACSGLYDRRMR